MEFAEENLQSDAPEPSLQRLMDDLGVHKLQLTREIAIVCQDAEWKTDAPDVLELAKYMFGVVTNTKWTLEDIFNELRDVEARQNKNRTANHFARWWYVVSAAKRKPTLGEIPQVNVTDTDLRSFHRAAVPKKLFIPGRHKTPPAVPKDNFLHDKIRVGGPAATRRSISAAMALLTDSPNWYRRTSLFWLGDQNRQHSTGTTSPMPLSLYIYIYI